jgi:hypothetical protein
MFLPIANTTRLIFIRFNMFYVILDAPSVIPAKAGIQSLKSQKCLQGQALKRLGHGPLRLSFSEASSEGLAL